MKLQYGIRRLILIQAGSHRFSDFPMDKPLSIHGRNNMGKSQTINGLQFLIFKNVQEMNFGEYDSQSSKAFYFRSEYSFIISEIMVKDGVFLYGAYGKGPLHGNDYEHFLIKTPFRREDFLEDDKHLKAKDVFARFERNGHRVHFLNRDQAKHALTGNYMAAGIPHDITMIPIKEVTESRYGVFKNIYKNLLTMRKINERDVKSLLLEVFANVLTNTSVDFFKVKSEAFRAHDSLEHEIKTLKKIEFQVDKLAQQRASKRDSLEDLSEIKTRLSQIYTIRLKQIPESMRKHQQSLSELDKDIQNANTYFRELMGKANLASQEIGQVRVVLKSIEDGHLRYELFSQFGGSPEQIAEKLNSRINDLHEQRVELSAQLSKTTHKSPESIRREIALTQRMLAQQQQRHDVIQADDSWLCDPRLNLLQGEKAWLSSVISDQLLALKMADIRGRDESATPDRAKDLATQLESGSFSFAGVVLNTSQIKPDAIEDSAEDIQAMIESTQLALAKLENELNVVTDLKASEDRLASLLANIDRETKERLEYLAYVERAKDEETLRHSLEEATQRQKVIGEEQAEHSAWVAEASRTRDALTKLIKGLEQEKVNLLEACTENFFRNDEIPLLDEIFHDEDSVIDAEMVESFLKDGKSLYGKFVGSSQEIKHLLDVIAADYSKHAGEESEDEAIRKLVDEVDALPEKANMLENFHTEAVTKLASALEILEKNYTRLCSSINDLNRKINSKKVSNLKSFKLKVLPNEQAISSIQTLLASIVKKDASRDMFADVEQPTDNSLYRDALKYLSEMVAQIGSITVSDLFQIAFEIVDESGKESVYTSLDGHASNGTTMTLKVLFNIHLIRFLYDQKVSTIHLPFYVDEATNIDDKNRLSLIAMADELGFVPVFASVDPIVTATYSIDLVEAGTPEGLLVTQESWIKYIEKEEKKAEDQMELI